MTCIGIFDDGDKRLEEYEEFRWDILLDVQGLPMYPENEKKPQWFFEFKKEILSDKTERAIEGDYIGIRCDDGVILSFKRKKDALKFLNKKGKKIVKKWENKANKKFPLTIELI